MRTNSVPLMNRNSLYQNINLYIDLSTDIDINIYMKINICLINTSLCQLTTSSSLPRFEIMVNVFPST